ncbi:dihydrodipicolinate reductase [Peribacillus cavernae]|nr:hypothetical protein [Peribacillus cavernae]MDQ0217853.1 dihydrodipicolinate reductase [Peribacillus cavernae]
MVKVVVTGAAGKIGLWTVRTILEAGHLQNKYMPIKTLRILNWISFRQLIFFQQNRAIRID